METETILGLLLYTYSFIGGISVIIASIKVGEENIDLKKLALWMILGGPLTAIMLAVALIIALLSLIGSALAEVLVIRQS